MPPSADAASPSGAFLRLALLALARLVAARAACAGACAGAGPGTLLLNATLERCLQRCRDSIGGCDRVDYEAAAGCCALGAAPGGCGPAWSAHAANASCGYGRGSAQPGVPCAACAVGSASHADVGDLAGVWRLTDAGGAPAGQLTVASGGSAHYSGGPRGQFVLWHARYDPRYPGAFFMEHQAVAVGLWPGWDYAWLEDADAGAPRLVVRRFCGSGPTQCAQLPSPEGSPFFERTLLGERESGAEPPCALLEGAAQASAGQAPGACCVAASAVVDVAQQAFAAAVELAGHGPWESLDLVNATWNTGPYDSFRSATLVFDPSNPELCSHTGGALAPAATGAVVALARRGSCAFAQKAFAAHTAGVQALIVVNAAGRSMPEFLTNTEGASSTPPLPTWMVHAGPGEQVATALAQGTGHEAVVRIGRLRTVDPGALRELCCPASCRDRVQHAVASGRGGGIDVAGTCARVDCSAFTPAPAPRAPVVLPHADGTCAACPAGLAAAGAGRASCAACGDGQTAGARGASCEPCPAGSAGLGGQCAPCGSGLVPEPLRRSCVPAPPAPTPAPAPPAPPNCPVCNQNCPTQLPVNNGGSGSDNQPTIITVTQSSGFNWGAVIGVVFSLSGLGCLGWLMRKMYLAWQLNGQVDTLAILRGSCGGLFSFGGAMAGAAATAVGRGDGARKGDTSKESGDEEAAPEAAEGTGTERDRAGEEAGGGPRGGRGGRAAGEEAGGGPRVGRTGSRASSEEPTGRQRGSQGAGRGGEDGGGQRRGRS